MPARPWACSVHVTPREVEVLNLLAQGFANEEIGVTLGLETSTVKHHIKFGPRTSCMFIPASFWPFTGLFLFSASVLAGMIVPDAISLSPGSSARRTRQRSRSAS
jgi:hypothetical protein